MKNWILLLFISQQSFCQVEPEAGNWKTWIISSVTPYRLPPPRSNEKAQTDSFVLLLGKNAKDKIDFWNAGSPGYRWLKYAEDISEGHHLPFRTTTLLSVGIYDATVAAWDNKYFYKRPRPKTNLSSPSSPSYPCEHSVTAGVAVTLLSYLYPNKKDSIELLGREACASRVAGGWVYPSDANAGFELGRKIALEVIAYSKRDGSDYVWKGTIPNEKGKWTGTRAVGIEYSHLKSYVMDSVNQFRPPPPPDFSSEMQELRNFKPTQASKARAIFYATQDFWKDVTDQKIFEYHLDQNPPRAARVYALKSIGSYEGFITAYEAKFVYWALRPFQYDTSYTPFINTPSHPGYPSGHATRSSSVATILSYLFPADSVYFAEKAKECAESRFEGGIHFRSDNDAGLVIGKKLGSHIIARARKDGAD